MLIHEGCILRRSSAAHEIIHHHRALKKRKSALAAHQNLSDFLNGSRTGGQKSEGRACLRCPLGEEAEDRNNRAGSQAASQKARASCLSQPGTSGHVSTSCPQKTSQALCKRVSLSAHRGNMASLHQQVSHFPALGFILCGRTTHTFQNEGTFKGLTTPRLYACTDKYFYHTETWPSIKKLQLLSWHSMFSPHRLGFG